MPQDRIRVFIVDDHPMIRVGLSTALSSEDDIEVVGDAASGEDALRLVPLARPDVVLMDLYLPGMDGIEATVRLAARLPDTKFVILTSTADSAEIERAIDAGAAGYILKTASGDDLAAVIRSSHQGRRVLAPEATDALIASRQQRGAGVQLTARERELLTLMARGLNNQEISAELSIALPTVKFHVTNILAKLEVENRTEAVLEALRLKLVRPPR